MIKQVKIIENNENKIIIKNKDDKVKIIKNEIFDLNENEIGNYEDVKYNFI